MTPRIGVSYGLRGWFAVLYDDEGPIQSAPGSFATEREAHEDAKAWGRAEGLPVDPLGADFRMQRRDGTWREEITE